MTIYITKFTYQSLSLENHTRFPCLLSQNDNKSPQNSEINHKVLVILGTNKKYDH